MNLKNLTDSALLSRVQYLVQRERELLSEILHHLKEIERRRLFSQLGFKSLFDYATKKLGYADDQAARRISAMRLLRELPELEQKIADGSLNLTNLGMAQSLFRHEQKIAGQSGTKSSGFSKQEKLDLLSQLENKSKREAEKIILSKASEPAQLKPDRITTLSDSTIEIRFMANSELQKKLERVKGLLAHSHPNISLGQAVDLLCEMAIKKLDPGDKRSKSGGPNAKTHSQTGRRLADRSTRPAPALKRRITSKVRRQVWMQAGGKCQICGSLHALQVDHIVPKAMGGGDERENLRLLCRACNQRAAINKFGLIKMERYLDGPSG